ncbi:helix-turn-helix domain-containing protein [Dyadobacter sp. NIV53]|uniref:helix-turn-helix domain-containing protein n=1 Tax=Dyadobacter sp. NIV53 TaxID=2861765 RepID=UPI001C885583|nr:helix-turn-helix transcriptional regulator [Dyadobacter sp. NIV53]
MTITDNIRAIRESLNLTQEVIADRLNTTRSNYAYLENRGEKLTIEQLTNISKALGVSINEVLYRGSSELNDVKWINDTKKKLTDIQEQNEYLRDLVAFYKEKDKNLKDKIKSHLMQDYYELADKHFIGRVRVKDLKTKKEIIYSNTEFNEYTKKLSANDFQKFEELFDETKYKIQNLYDGPETKKLMNLAVKEENFMNEIFRYNLLGLVESEFLLNIFQLFLDKIYGKKNENDEAG